MSKTCHNCGWETKFENIVSCPHCGKMLINEAKDSTVSESVSIVNENEDSHTENIHTSLPERPSKQLETNNICPICCTKVEENDEAITCPDCQIIYHKDCWIDNNGCATYGCPSSGCLAPPPPKISFGEDNEVLQDNTEHITKQSSESIVCPYCQTVLSANTKFCWNCGKDLPEKQIDPKDTDQTDSPSPIQTPVSTNCSFGKKVLAVCACAVFCAIVLLIFIISGNSMNDVPWWLYFIMYSGSCGIWKSITGEKKEP